MTKNIRLRTIFDDWDRNAVQALGRGDIGYAEFIARSANMSQRLERDEGSLSLTSGEMQLIGNATLLAQGLVAASNVASAAIEILAPHVVKGSPEYSKAHGQALVDCGRNMGTPISLTAALINTMAMFMEQALGDNSDEFTVRGLLAVRKLTSATRAPS